jgi:hypothetical protein
VACVVAIVVLSEVIQPKDRQIGREYLLLVYAEFLTFAALGYLIRYVRIIRIDARGVTAHRRTGYGLRSALVPWEEIDSVDVVEVNAAFGPGRCVIPVLKDLSGDVLFKGLTNLRSVSADERAKVIRALEARFGHLSPRSSRS